MCQEGGTLPLRLAAIFKKLLIAFSNKIFQYIYVN